MNDIMREAILKHCKKHKYSKQYTAYWIAHLFCEICGKVSSAPHHIRTRGAGGGDEAENLLAFCNAHHDEVNMGIITFAKKYEQFYDKIFAALDIECVGSVR